MLEAITLRLPEGTLERYRRTAELETLHRLGNEGRGLTLRRAQAYELLKQRGSQLPTWQELEQSG